MSFPENDPRDLFEHRLNFQRRNGFAEGPILLQSEKDLWSAEYKRDWAQLKAYREVRRADYLVLKSQRRAALVPHGMATRSKRTNPLVLPSRRTHLTARMSTGGIAPRRPEVVPEGN